MSEARGRHLADGRRASAGLRSSGDTDWVFFRSFRSPRLRRRRMARRQKHRRVARACQSSSRGRRDHYDEVCRASLGSSAASNTAVSRRDGRSATSREIPPRSVMTTPAAVEMQKIHRSRRARLIQRDRRVTQRPLQRDPLRVPRWCPFSTRSSSPSNTSERCSRGTREHASPDILYLLGRKQAV